MTKIITIQSCRECPCNHTIKTDSGRQYQRCIKGAFNYGDKSIIDALPPNYIHPDCKLNDLPTVEEIKAKAIAFSDWLEKIPLTEKISVWSKDGQYKGIFIMDNEQLFEKFNKINQ